MGRIVEEVEHHHLRDHPGERAFLEPFLPLFDVTWADSFVNFGTSASAYFLKPEPETKQTFGFEREILLVYSAFHRFEPRLIQLVDKIMSMFPARTRVEPLGFLLVHNDPNIRENITQVTSSTVQAKTIVPFSRMELDSGANHWFVQRRISENFFARDLFDMTQNLVEDTYFFGRHTLVQDLTDRFKRGQNTGVFGLRKTGKTSAISKVGRIITSNNLGFVAVLDANDPAYYRQRWWELLGTVVMKVAGETSHQPTKGMEPFMAPDTAAGGFAASMNYIFSRLASPRDRVLLVVDEFEHITPGFSLADHWQTDFLPFWQTMRAYQARRPSFSFLLAGVNPHVTEKTMVAGHDNPLFALIPKLFVPRFSREEVGDMVGTLGRYMGMRFSRDAFEYLGARYGGHPMLIRLACSWMHRRLIERAEARPFSIEESLLRSTESERDASLAPYVQHVLDVLTSWYPMEYEMLEMLCLGHTSDYEDMAKEDPQLREHLQGYGLVHVDGGHTSAAAGLIADYIRVRSRRQRKPKEGEVVAREATQVWSAELEGLADSLVHSRTFCQELAQTLGAEVIFEEEDKPRVGAKLADLRVRPLSLNRDQFESTVNTLQQLFWDCIPGDRRQRIAEKYPALFAAADTIRCLRHWLHHPTLTDPAVRRTVMEYIQSQVGGFPTTGEEWAKLHLDLTRNLVGGLKDAQGRMFRNRTSLT